MPLIFRMMRSMQLCRARLLFLIALLGGAAMTGISPAAVGATTVTASIFTDPPPGACVTTGTGACSLREATLFANAHPGTAITLLPGVYTLTIPPAPPNDATTGSLKITANTTVAVAGGGGGDD